MNRSDRAGGLVLDVTYRFSGFSVDAMRRLLLGPDGQPIALKPRVFDTLLYLIEHRGELLEKQTLLDAIWPNVVVEENNLNQAISTLRRVFGESRDEHRFIVTEPGRGYRFVARVERVMAEPPAPAAETSDLLPADTRVPVMQQEPDRSNLPPLPSQSAGRPTTAPRWLWPAVAVIAVAAIALVIAEIFRSPPAPVAANDAMRFDIAGGTGPAGTFVVISPDGRRVAFAGARQGSSVEIWVRSLETQEASPLGATFADLGGWPFWSADSRYIIFSDRGKLRRVDTSGGPAQLLGDVGTPVSGGFTTEDGRLVYSEIGGGVWETSFAGGTPVPLDLGPNRAAARTPSVLPDGSVVYCQCGEADEFGIYLATPGAGAPRRLLPERSGVQYAPSSDPELGYLLFVRYLQTRGEGTLMAQAIRPRELRLIGDPVAIAENVRVFSASDTGVLVYSGGESTFVPAMPGFVQGQLTWFDREGRIVSTVGEQGVYRELVLSPDQQHVAVTRADPTTRGIHIHLLELARGVSSRLTSAAAGETSPVWAPDGASVIFARWDSSGTVEWYRRATSLAGGEELVFQALDSSVPTGISPDGRFTLSYSPSARADIKAVDLTRVAEAREPVSLVSSQFNELYARFSPDGRWFAHASNESGTNEIYVRPFNPDAGPSAPSADGRVLVSKGGATFGGAIWRADGTELFYVSRDGTVMVVPVSIEPTFSVGSAPQALFKLPAPVVFFDVSQDGERFLIAVPDVAAASPPPYRVIVNWTSTLR